MRASIVLPPGRLTFCATCEVALARLIDEVALVVLFVDAHGTPASRGEAPVPIEHRDGGGAFGMARAGDEVVQLYLMDQVSSVTRPVKELRGFARVTLKPGESTAVSFTLGPAELSLIDRRMHRVVEPGRFEIMVGTSATPTLTTTLDVFAR